MLGHAAITTTMRYIHHTLDELAKATTVLETGGVFDPNVGPGASSVSHVRPIAENTESGGVH
jgi:hypothetical protein